MQEDYRTNKSDLKCCCPTKQYYTNDVCNLGTSLKILPRIIIFKKGLKVHTTYECTLNVCNKGAYKRYFVYSTDSSDTTVRVSPTELTNNFLQPDQSLKISIHIEPLTKLNINRRRHVLITSQHPNITYSIPLIILDKNYDNDISVPFSIAFPSTTVENFTYYEMILYNSSAQKYQFNIKCALPNLTVHANSFSIKKSDYGKILLKLYCKDCKVVDHHLKLKFNTAGGNLYIPFKHEPLRCSLFVHTFNINFDCVRFKRKRTEELSICNESNNDILFNVNFISPEESSSHDNEGTLPATICDAKTPSSDLIGNETQNVDKFPYRHFVIESNCGTVRVNSRYFIKILFCPIVHEDFLANYNDISPFSVNSAISISWRNDMKTEERKISLKGQIIGPEIEIFPPFMDLRHVYFGEEHCARITLLNKDDLCDAHVQLDDLPNDCTARIVAIPEEGLYLKPNQSDIFHIKFYCTVIGKFLVKLKFKVKYGCKYSMIIKGHGKPVQVKSFPKMLHLGVIPIAIPQKRNVLLVNPLTVPLTVQCTVREDGNETPLVLNAENLDGHLPITTKGTLNYLKQSYNQNSEEEFDFRDTEDGSNSSHCSEFKRSALDFIPEMSHKLVSHLKANKILDKPEIEKKVIEQAINSLLNTPYFSHIDTNKNYTQLDWNSVATNPKELYCNTEIIYLRPNTSKSISILVIPNVMGSHNKYIDLRACPIIEAMPETAADHKENNNFSQIVETKYNMTSELHIEYTCAVPQILWDNEIVMREPLYAGETYDFEMVFHNNSNLAGFFYYDVIPHSSLGVMKISNNKWKYFIEPAAKIHVPGQVKFTKLGSTTISGFIKFVGFNASYPFHIKGQVLPPKLNIVPQSICKALTVLEFAQMYILIENITPTITWFQLKLKDESGMSVEPCGGELAPDEQAVYATLSVCFQDPGIYKNILYAYTEFETIATIPITITVKGIPISFEPEVRAKDLNVGYILCNTEDDNREDQVNFCKVIKVINKGLRCYRLSITRTKCSTELCSISTPKCKLIIKPNNLIVAAGSENIFSIFISCSESTSVYNEFRIQLADLNDVTHMENSRFSVSATFIMPQLSWSRRAITISYYRTLSHKQWEQWENIKLTNTTKNHVNDVNLKLSGPFKIKELFEQQYEGELNFSMAGLETKEFFITFNKEIIRNSFKTLYEGCISCNANSKVQKTVRIKLFVFVPNITLNQSQITLFTKETEGRLYIELTNTGNVTAVYKWKKLKEDWNYISQEDDAEQVASIILSDLMRMLELDNPEIDSETNMSRRYQKYKCFLKDFHDSNYIKEILYEIIDNLDLDRKRYKLVCQQTTFTTQEVSNEVQQFNYTAQNVHFKIDEELEKQMSQLLKYGEEEINNIDDLSQSVYVGSKIEPNSSDGTMSTENLSAVESCVYYTLDDILTRLKLENSYEVLSLPSSETCQSMNSIYFFKKYGSLQEKQRESFALHLPPVRKGYEVQSIFELDVVGGKSQQLEITLANVDKSVILSNHHIYIGRKPWYERYRTKSCIENITNRQLSLKLQKIPRKHRRKLPKIAVGSNNILGGKTFELAPFQNAIVRTEGIMGFNDDFKTQISIIINDSEEKLLEFYGRGEMPMLTMHNAILPLLPQHPYEIIEEYNLLQKLFYFDIFKTITEKDDELYDAMQEDENSLQPIQSNLTDLSLISTETLNESHNEKASLDREFLRTYVLINNNEDLPNYAVLDQLLQTEMFLNCLSYNAETSTLLTSLYENYLLLFKTYDNRMSFNLRYFNVQSLPFHLRTHLLNMGIVYLNQYCKFHITLEFIGPGKLIAAARTAVKIPGLMIDFHSVETDKINNFIYYSADDELTLCDKPYRNINERLSDNETNPKVKHAHSYDFNHLHQHQRTATALDKKCQKNYYNSLNKSIYAEQKHHFTHCKVKANSKDTFSSFLINVNILFRPKRTFFGHNQCVEDYLFIDLHMGATLPILLRAVIIDRNRKEPS